MRKILLLLCISSVLICCLSDGVELTSENTIKMSECTEILVQIQTGDEIEDEIFYLTTIKGLSKLYKRELLSYVGSDENYHFIFWYTKVHYYEDQTCRFAVLRNEFAPKKEFNVKEHKIGENIF